MERTGSQDARAIVSHLQWQETTHTAIYRHIRFLDEQIQELKQERPREQGGPWPTR
jgi:hypothetical protein